MTRTERPPANAVGIVANPLAGKDLRRLTSGATPVSDAVKIGAIGAPSWAQWRAGQAVC